MKFITGEKDVYKKICELLSGEEGIFIVAYIGKNMTRFLNKTSKSKIVCDIKRYTACDPREVKKIINKGHYVHKYNDLHAKVYVSNNGAFVSSKNMTTAESYEAGIYYQYGTNEFWLIKEWAEKFYKNDAEEISERELEILSAEREAYDLGKMFNENKIPKSKKERKMLNVFSSIPEFGGIAFWVDEFDAKDSDSSLDKNPDDIVTVKQWYEEYNLDENTVFQDEYDDSYLKTIRPFLHKNYISVEVSERKKNPINKPNGIIKPFIVKGFTSKKKMINYFLTGYTSNNIEDRDTKEIKALLNGIWNSKLPSFLNWKKTKAYDYWWMDSKTLDSCINEYLASK